MIVRSVSYFGLYSRLHLHNLIFDPADKASAASLSSNSLYFGEILYFGYCGFLCYS